MKNGIHASLFLAIATLGNANACMWDRDTLGQEANGLPDVLRVITSRFERNPPRYFEMRLAGIEAEYDSAPDSEKLSLCDDDTGVACDRLQWDSSRAGVSTRGQPSKRSDEGITTTSESLRQ